MAPPGAGWLPALWKKTLRQRAYRAEDAAHPMDFLRYDWRPSAGTTE